MHLRRKGHPDLVSAVHDLPQAPGEIPLHRGDTLMLLRALKSWMKPMPPAPG